MHKRIQIIFLCTTFAPNLKWYKCIRYVRWKCTTSQVSLTIFKTECTCLLRKGMVRQPASDLWSQCETRAVENVYGLQGVLLADVRVESLAVKTLLAYHPFWLKLGLELVLANPLRLKERKLSQQLETVIRKQLLRNSQGKPGIGVLKQNYWVRYYWILEKSELQANAGHLKT